MRVLFLDIDGVLNHCDWHEGDARPALRPSCVRQLNRIIRETRTGIVLVSNWRHWVNRGEISRAGFNFLLATHGVVGARIVGVTGERRKQGGRRRGGMVTRWLRRHPTVTAFAVLDDLAEGPEPQWVRQRQVSPSTARGLTAREARRVIELLRTSARPRHLSARNGRA